jgi:siroheme synthase-like protein
MEYFPIFTDLHGKSILVIGNYRVLEFKIEKLLQSGARVRFLSDFLSEKLENYVKTEKIEYYQGRFKNKYFRDVWLVICGSNDLKLKTRVSRETEKRKIFCNFVDEAPLCSFISPSVLTKGDITIAISTDGKSPALNKYLKQKIDAIIGDEYKYLADLLGKVRPRVIETIPDQKQRSALFDSIVAHPRILDLIKNRNYTQAKQLVTKLIDEEINH